jgi:hypothetical protein
MNSSKQDENASQSSFYSSPVSTPTSSCVGHCLRFKVFLTVKIWIVVLWVMKRFESTYHLHLQEMIESSWDVVILYWKGGRCKGDALKEVASKEDSFNCWPNSSLFQIWRNKHIVHT